MPDQDPRALPPRTTFEQLRRRIGAMARPLPLFAALCFWLHDYDTAPEAARRESDPARSLTIALRKVGLGADPSQVLLLPDATPRGAVTKHERAVALARRPGEPADVYLICTRRAPEGNLLEISSITNLTDTSAADEQSLVVNGERAAWAVSQEGKLYAVYLADFRGEPRPAGKEWTLPLRAQNAITNLQETGQLSGIG
ncbi:MAG TPA: hypothetical protein VGQ57_12090, partial [Polyangiaceae bacterium]|nr:hypothetical protein [Polyangiaceae bacterium]